MSLLLPALFPTTTLFLSPTLWCSVVVVVVLGKLMARIAICSDADDVITAAPQHETARCVCTPLVITLLYMDTLASVVFTHTDAIYI